MDERERYWGMTAGLEAGKAAIVCISASKISDLEIKHRALKARAKALIVQNPNSGHGRETTLLRRERFPTGLSCDFWE